MTPFKKDINRFSLHRNLFFPMQVEMIGVDQGLAKLETIKKTLHQKCVAVDVSQTKMFR